MASCGTSGQRPSFQFLKETANESGLAVPPGLKHVWLHHGTSRKEVYKYMYGQLVCGGKMVPVGTTLVYPDAIRAVVRERFPGEAGAYDAQYEDNGTHLSLEQILRFEWRAPRRNVLCARTGAPDHALTNTAFCILAEN